MEELQHEEPRNRHNRTSRANGIDSDDINRPYAGLRVVHEHCEESPAANSVNSVSVPMHNIATSDVEQYHSALMKKGFRLYL
jgi:hypothetical protein